MPESNAILISIFHLQQQMYSDVTSVIDMLVLEGKYFQVNDNSLRSHLIIIDVDGESGKEKLQQSMSGQVKLLLSSKPVSGKNIISVQKPVNVNNLKSVLTKLYSMMQMHLVNSNKLENNSSEEFSIKETLFFTLLKAKNNKGYLQISYDRLKVFIDGDSQSVKTDNSLEEVRKLVSIPFTNLKIDKIGGSVFQAQTQNLNVITLHNILWSAAIFCSNGHLLPGHDENKAVKLRAWPSFTRNDFNPEHLKIAALLAQRAISLKELSKQTKISYSEIVNFYNAAFSVDLIDLNISDLNYEKHVVQPKQNAIKSTLLNKIAARLGFSQRINGTYNG